MINKSTMQALRETNLNGDFDVEVLGRRLSFTARGAATFYNHVDWQFKTKADHDKVIRELGRSWKGNPSVIRYGRHEFTWAFHTYNHSVPVASNAYNIVSPTLKRTLTLANGKYDPKTLGVGFERDVNGNWNRGSHKCGWTRDSRSLRGNRNTSYDLDMHNAVMRAEQLVGAKDYSPVEIPQVTLVYQVQVIASSLRVRSRPDVNSTHLTSIPNGDIVTIVRESSGVGADKWGQIKSTQPELNGGWISLDFTIKLTPVPPTGDVWRVQVSASHDEVAILSVVTCLLTAGHDAYHNHYGAWHRAQVGRFNTRAEALEYEKILKSQGYPTFVKVA